MELFPIPASQIALATRPRGGDWLERDLSQLKRAGFLHLISMLTPAEERELGLTEEATLARQVGVVFCSIPLADRGIPESTRAFVEQLAPITPWLHGRVGIAVHCRQGIGRSAMFAAALLVVLGIAPEDAWRAIEVARGRPVPDTPEQRAWLSSAAPALRNLADCR